MFINGSTTFSNDYIPLFIGEIQLNITTQQHISCTRLKTKRLNKHKHDLNLSNGHDITNIITLHKLHKEMSDLKCCSDIGTLMNGAT